MVDIADVMITGWGHSRFGKRPEATLEDLVVEVGREALRAAALDPGDVDAIFLGTFNGGLLPLGFASSLALQIADGLIDTPATRVENACASGSAAVHQAITTLLAGQARHVLVIGAEKMTHATPADVGRALLGADYESAGKPSTTGFAGLFASVALAYEARYGPISDVLGVIAAKSHRQALSNPYAHLHKDLSADFCSTVSEANPMVAAPLRRTDCSPVSDGAAALILSTSPSRQAMSTAVRIVGTGHANDFLPSSRRDPLAFRGTEIAWARALTTAGLKSSDLDLVELHDCFTIAELNLYEVLGLAERGHGREIVDSGLGEKDGRLPINPSGGLKSKGHPVGATGVSQHVLAAMQLSGTAGGMQIPDASTAAVHNMGGLAVANYVTVLQAQ